MPRKDDFKVTQQPRIFPVIERASPIETFWLPLPAEPWPDYIELSRSSPAESIALVVLALSTYGHRDPEAPLSAAELADDFPTVAAGGLAISDGTFTVYPSCCCGLEGWRAWQRLLASGESPWLGHNPAPWVEQVDDDFVIWADGGLGRFQSGSTRFLRLSRDQLERGITSVDAALEGFAESLDATLARWNSGEASAIATAFREVFLAPDQPGESPA